MAKVGQFERRVLRESLTLKEKPWPNSVILPRKGVGYHLQWKQVSEFPDQGKDQLFLYIPTHTFSCIPLGVESHVPFFFFLSLPRCNTFLHVEALFPFFSS